MNKKDFDICYKLRNEDETYLAPQVLPKNTPDKYTEWNYRETLRFQYVYNFMPEGIVNRVTVRLSDLITDISEVWNGGVVLSRGSNQALVKEGFHKDGRKIIDISVKGNAYTGKELLILIRHEIDQINDHSYKGIEVRKYIPCYHEECLKSEHSGFFDYRKLMNYVKNHRTEIDCSVEENDSLHVVSVNKLLEGVGMAGNDQAKIVQSKTIRIFLASSAELKEDRELFEQEIYRRCKTLKTKGIFLHLDIWEDLSTRMSTTRSQDEYNKEIMEADIFVLLASTKVGKFTEEEFDRAHKKFTDTGKPFIHTYFKVADISTGDMENMENLENLKSLVKFKQKLVDMEHFKADYDNFDSLWKQFNKELERIIDS